MTRPASSPEQLFNEVAQFIHESHDLIGQGAMLQLAGLDERVKILCEQVLRLSQEERVMYADKLQQLLGELRGLGETLVEQRDKLAHDIRSLSQHERANMAYRVINHVDKKNNDG